MKSPVARRSIARRGVVLIEVMNNLVMRGDPAKLPRVSPSAPYGGVPLRCFRLDDSNLLLFATPLDDAELARRLPALKRLF